MASAALVVPKDDLGQHLSGVAYPLLLSHLNHFKFGYDGRWFEERQSPQDTWCVDYGRSSRPARDWRSECIETARLIRDDTSLDLWVLFSGGIDSEVVLQSFIFAGIPVRAAITRFRNDLNRQDTRFAVKFCETHRIPYKLLDIDIVEFFESGDAFAYAERTRCVQPQLLHTMWAMDKVDGYPILGSAECYLVKRSAQPDFLLGADEDPNVWEMFEKERIASWYRHLMVRNRDGCAGFFQYNPENMLSFLTDCIMEDLCLNRIPNETDTMSLKGAIYRKHFLLEPRPKYHGFENVLHLDDRLRPILERSFGDHNGIVKTPYDKLVAMLSPEHGSSL
jgi:hypothetical protein